MFVKQIDEKTALELAAKGKEVLVMEPITTDPEKWIDYEPNTLEHMLEGCMFFRRELAMEVELAGPAETEPAQPDPPSRKEAKKAVDVGKLIALHNAGVAGGKDCGRVKGFGADGVRTLAEDERGGRRP